MARGKGNRINQCATIINLLLNISDLPKGVYFLKVDGGNQTQLVHFLKL